MAQVAQYAATNARPGDMDAADARRFLPPPGIHPNNAVFGAVALPKPLTWQRREHAVQRRNILGRVGQLLERNAQMIVGSNVGMDAASSKTWALARKLEVLMFLSSASLMEYSNVDSLARRVQALTASIVNKKIRKEIVDQAAAATTATATAAHPAGACAAPGPTLRSSMAPPLVTAARPCAPAVVAAAAASPMNATVATVPMPFPGGFGGDAAGIKRTLSDVENDARVGSDMMVPVGEIAKRTVKRVRRSSDLGLLLFRGFDDMSKMIWSFVDGTQIMRCRGVNRAARLLAPLFVTSLQLSCNAVQIALATPAGKTSVLGECVNLRELEIVSLSSGMTFGKLSMRATNCPQRFVVTHDDHEQIVLALSDQLRFNAFPRLTRLGLTCLFTNEEADGEADVLLNNLMLGCCPHLEELCLPGNSFGDYGACKVAQMLRSRVCPKLTRLDLRRNFIGEEGVRSLCAALADGCAPNLVELCLGGNTITDSSFHHVLYAMESGRLRKLRFLGLEMNYLTATSLEMLGRTIGKLVCPVLTQISYSENSVDNSEAKRIISTAVYHERMRQVHYLQQQQQQEDLSQYRPRRIIIEQSHESYSDDEDDDESAYSSAEE
ncbi:TPA: hypothetical protein N0F65_006512 [Lagenidium giganteum]|uniref:Uncharacterized protein n=1 Tax=Lagenidium giganteum TaxID=4803 RepID=A0AAV2YQF7_9STRA|nr:TPA: hypothetical protein N0F65_006512 [Lagenidium giganteum]